jgi:hypothetical protein
LENPTTFIFRESLPIKKQEIRDRGYGRRPWRNERGGVDRREEEAHLMARDRVEGE